MHPEAPATAALPFGAFERVVETLAAAEDGRIALVALSRHEASFFVTQSLGSVHVCVLRCDDTPRQVIADRVSALLADAKAMPLDLVLVGGDASLRALMRRPFFTPQRIGFLQLQDAAPTWESKTNVAAKLLAKGELRAADAESWARLHASSAAARQRLAAEGEQLAAFGAVIASRKPVVTYAIAALILAVFGIEALAGGSESLVVLLRLGGLVPSRLSQGELWRLISCTFLHAGWMHVALNVYVLVVLGTFLEKIIGSARLLLLYTVAAIAGSLGSWALLKAPLSVGASGAVWGLLGAHAILAYRDRGLLPAALIPGARKAALINLGINVVNSFRPNVDMWAHFAGGAAGMALFASGLLTSGIPRLGALEHEALDGSVAGVAEIPTPRSLRVASALAGLLLLAGLAAGIASGRPQLLVLGDPGERVDVPRIGVSVVLPSGLRAKTIESPNGPEVLFGDPLSDPMSVVLFSSQLTTPLDAAGIERELTQLGKQLRSPPQSTAVGTPRRFALGALHGLTARYRYPSGLLLERGFLFYPTRIVRAEVIRWPRFRRLPHGGSAERLLASVKAL